MTGSKKRRGVLCAPSRFPLDEGFVWAFDSFELLKKLNTTEREREREIFAVCCWLGREKHYFH